MAIPRAGVFLNDYLESMINQSMRQTKYCLGLFSQSNKKVHPEDDEFIEKMKQEIEANQENALGLCAEKVLLAKQAYDLVGHIRGGRVFGLRPPSTPAGKSLQGVEARSAGRWRKTLPRIADRRRTRLECRGLKSRRPARPRNVAEGDAEGGRRGSEDGRQGRTPKDGMPSRARLGRRDSAEGGGEPVNAAPTCLSPESGSATGVADARDGRGAGRRD
ncbi:PHD finger protein [Nymphaea thermarum]|nr:PHD finger protein [Nymphaea thermarum]